MVATAKQKIVSMKMLAHRNRMGLTSVYHGAPVAQWVKRWPTDIAVPSWSPARGEIFSTIDRVPLHTAFHYQPLSVLI